MRKRKGQGSGESPTSARRIMWAQQRARALEMRLGGASLQSIVVALGYANRTSVARALRLEMGRFSHPQAEELRELELGRLDAMLSAIWERCRNGELDAIDRALKISSHRRSLVPGLEVPRDVILDGKLETNERHEWLVAFVQRAANDPAALAVLHQFSTLAASMENEPGSNGSHADARSLASRAASGTVEPSAGENGDDAEEPLDR